MYLGYMKRGAEFMIMFAASVYFAAVTISSYSYYYNQGYWGIIFLILLPIIWLYQMFDSMHAISQLKRLQIEFPEDDGFFIPGVSDITNLNALNFFKKRKVTKTIAGILLGIGIYFLLANSAEGIYRLLYNITEEYQREQYAETYHLIMSYVPPVIISLILIFAGIKLLLGSKKNNKDNKNGGE